MQTTEWVIEYFKRFFPAFCSSSVRGTDGSGSWPCHIVSGFFGSSYLPSDILAAFLYAQLRERETIMTHRRRVWSYYHECLKDWTDQHGIRRPTIPENCESAHHMYHLVLRSEKDRDGLIDHLKGLGILAVSHYVPLHLSKMGRHFGGRHGMCPVTEEVCPRLIRLPFFNDMTVDEQDQVIDAVLNWRS